jgi:hypothetical protein
VPYVDFKNITVTNTLSQSIFVLSPQDVASWTGLGRAEVSNNNITFDSTAGEGDSHRSRWQPLAHHMI